MLVMPSHTLVVFAPLFRCGFETKGGSCFLSRFLIFENKAEIEASGADHCYDQE